MPLRLPDSPGDRTPTGTASEVCRKLQEKILLKTCEAPSRSDSVLDMEATQVINPDHFLAAVEDAWGDEVGERFSATVEDDWEGEIAQYVGAEIRLSISSYGDDYERILYEGTVTYGGKSFGFYHYPYYGETRWEEIRVYYYPYTEATTLGMAPK